MLDVAYMSDQWRHGVAFRTPLTRHSSQQCHFNKLWIMPWNDCENIFDFNQDSNILLLQYIMVLIYNGGIIMEK